MTRLNVSPDDRRDADSGGCGTLTEATRNLTWTIAEGEPPQAEQPEAAQAEQSAGAGSLLGAALQEQIAQAVRPILGKFEQRIVQTVRQQTEQAGQEGPQGDEPQQEGAEAAQSSLQAAVQGTATSSKQTVQWLGKTLATSLQAVRSLLQAVVSLLRTVVLTLKDALTVVLRLVMQVLASVVQQLGEILRPMLLEAVHQLVQPLLQAAAERGVAAVLKTLESPLQERPQAQPAPAGAEEAAASAAR